MSKFLSMIVLALTILWSGAAVAQVTPEPIIDPEPIIEAVQTPVSDGKIKTRIENIFQEIDGVENVTVTVTQGVVTLGGETANEANAATAERLAIRLEGVVTVQDEINRTLSVRDNVTPMLENFRTDMSALVKALPLIGFALLAMILIGFLGGFLSRRKTLWQKIAPNPFLAELLAQAVRLVFWLVGLAIAMNILGATALLAGVLGGAGVIGIAISFAVRDSLENYISSIMLSLRQPFRAKDHVLINEHEGIVVRLTSRATVLMTLDGNHLRIPNSTVFKGVILNYTTNPERRFTFEIGVDSEDDPIAAMKTGLDAIRAHDFILKDPEPSAIIKTIGDSNIVIRFAAWVDQSKTNFGKGRSLAIRSATQILDEQGFSMPEPIYRLRFDPRLSAALEGGFPKTAKGQIEPAKEKKSQEISQNDDIMDVSPDRHLEDKINEERIIDGGSDLLDQDRPTE